MDILTSQTDITFYIRKELIKHVNALARCLLENDEYELRLFRGNQAHSVHFSISMLQKYGNKKWNKKVHMKIAKTLLNSGGDYDEQV